MSKNKARRFKDKNLKYEDRPTKVLEEEFPVRLSMWYFD